MINLAAILIWVTRGKCWTLSLQDKSYAILPSLLQQHLNIFKMFLWPCVLCRRPRGVISTPLIRTFGRGARYYGRGFKSQGSYQVSYINHCFSEVPFHTTVWWSWKTCLLLICWIQSKKCHGVCIYSSPERTNTICSNTYLEREG